MNGMERLTDAAARHGWTRDHDFHGYTRTVRFRRGDQMVEVYRRVDGGVTYGSRSWGSRTSTTAPKVADQVLTWMQEPTPDDETDRGFFFRLATGHGWTFKGIDSGDVYAWSAHRITLRFRTHQSVLGDAQRNFGGPGEVRSIHTNVPANITPWFHAFMDRKGAGYDCGCTGLARSLEPAQEAARPVIRPAVPQAPDRKLQRLLEELEASFRTLSQELEGRRIRPEGSTDWAWGQNALSLANNRLRRLEADVLEARLLAFKLWSERATDGE